MKILFEFPKYKTYLFKWFCTLSVLTITSSCSSTKYLDQGTILYSDDVDNTVTVSQSQIPFHKIQKIETPITAEPVERISISGQPKANIKPLYPVAQQIVDNYMKSTNKEPGGHCLTASKTRFLDAYQQVYGHTVYQDLPQDIATKYYTPKQVFDHLYASTSGRHKGWLTLPRKFRGRGNAGAIANAGMGELVNEKEIWSGKLRPGAPMQVWRDKKDYRAVVKGISDPKIDPFGHSFIFLNYVRDSEDKIIGIKMADQGYQCHRMLVPSDYEVWWGVNLKI